MNDIYGKRIELGDEVLISWIDIDGSTRQMLYDFNPATLAFHPKQHLVDTKIGKAFLFAETMEFVKMKAEAGLCEIRKLNE